MMPDRICPALIYRAPEGVRVKPGETIRMPRAANGTEIWEAPETAPALGAPPRNHPASSAHSMESDETERRDAGVSLVPSYIP